MSRQDPRRSLRPTPRPSSRPSPRSSPSSTSIARSLSERAPPQLWFGVSAVFHYLGPSFAVLLFPAVGVLGVAWLRIASAAAIFAPFTRPWRVWRQADGPMRRLLLGLAGCLAVMNTAFYLALERLPMSLVAAMEFLAVLGLAAWGMRTWRNAAALGLAAAGVAVLIDLGGLDRSAARDPLGLLFAAVNAALFALYVALGHRAAEAGAGSGVERLGAAMAAAFLMLAPVGIGQASVVFFDPVLLLAGIGVGLCSSVIPYVCDQLAMARLPRASFALMLSLLPAVATAVGALVLLQIPSALDLAGVALVMAGVALHRPAR